MNTVHGRFRAANADMLYVLSTFVCEPILWLDRFGRRGMTLKDRRAWPGYYRALGERRGTRDFPAVLLVGFTQTHLGTAMPSRGGHID